MTLLADIATREVFERWAVVRGPFGGYLAAMLAEAALEQTGWPLRTLAIHFLDAPAPGPVDVAVEVTRRGRSSDGLALALDQGGRPMARALAVSGAWREDEPAWLELPVPAAPPPEECRPIERVEGMVPFLDELEILWVDGGSPGGESGAAYNLAWTRTGDQLDQAVLAALGDVWLPPAFGKLGRPAIVPTLDLTLHFREGVPAGEEWVLAEHRSDHAAGGTWTCDSVLWSREGRPLLQARQLAMIRA